MSTIDEPTEHDRLQAEIDKMKQDLDTKFGYVVQPEVTIKRGENLDTLTSKPITTTTTTTTTNRATSNSKQIAARSAGVAIFAVISICVLVLANAVNICAVVFAYQEYERDVCPGHDICSLDCNPDAFMDVSIFLQIVGFSMMALSLVGFCASLLICPPNQSDARDSSVPHLLWRGVVFLYYSSWVIVGSVLDRKLRDECKSTPKGQMFLAWIIIYAIFAICCSWRKS